MSRRRDLALLLVGAAVSTVGTSFTLMAVAIHVRPAGAVWVAGAMAAELVPVVVLAPVAGRLVDRVPNRGLLLASLALQGAAVALAAAVGLTRGREAVLVAALVGVGAGSAVTAPTIAAMLPHVSGEDAATRAYGWYGAITQVGFLAGFATSGLLIEATSVRTALLLDAASFAVLAVAVALVRGHRVPTPAAAGDPSASAWAGFAALRTDRLLGIGVGGVAAAILVTVVVNVAEVFYVLEDIGAGPGAYGLVTALWPAAGVVGGWWAGRLVGDRAMYRALAVATVVMGLALAVAGAAVSLVAVGIGWTVGGAANALQRVALTALVRSRVDDAVRGRAFAAVGAVLQVGNVVGLAAGAAVVGLVGARSSIVGAGLAAAAVGVGVGVLGRRPASVAAAV